MDPGSEFVLAIAIGLATLGIWLTVIALIVRRWPKRSPEVMATRLGEPRKAFDWPKWPVVRELGDRQPQVRSYKANR